MIVVIGFGRIGAGPLLHQMVKSKKEVAYYVRKAPKWDIPLLESRVCVFNARDGNYTEMQVVDGDNESVKIKSNPIVIVTDNIFKAISETQDLELLIVSVGAELEAVVKKLPKVKVPILLLENNYEVAKDLLKENAYIRPSVLDCHSPLMQYRGTSILMDFDTKMDVQIYDPDGRIEQLLHGNFVYCNSISELEIYHARKFYGINLPHRILGYLSYWQALSIHKNVDDLSEKIGDYCETVLDEYRIVSDACIKASFFSNPERIREFFEVDTLEEAMPTYVTTLKYLSELIVKKTISTGDTFTRVIKSGTNQFQPRIEETERMVQFLLNDLASRKELVKKLLLEQEIDVIKELEGFYARLEEIKSSRLGN